MNVSKDTERTFCPLAIFSMVIGKIKITTENSS